jgi:hypothetical protein
MNVPQLLFGPKRDVLRRGKRFWKDFVAGNADVGPMVDTSEVAGYLMLNPKQTQGSESDFQMFPIADAAAGDVPRRYPQIHSLFDYLRSSPWGALCLLNDSMGLFALSDARLNALLGDVVRHWPIYMTLGKRFKPVFSEQLLWEASTEIRYLVIKAGVSQSELPKSLPDDDLRAFLARYPDKFGSMLSSSQS